MQASHSKIHSKKLDFRTFLGKILGQFRICLVLNLGQFRTKLKIKDILGHLCDNIMPSNSTIIGEI